MYLVNLTLPYSAADDRRYGVPLLGRGGTAQRQDYDPEYASVTRAAVDELSDWTVSSDTCEAAAIPEPGISLAGGLISESVLFELGPMTRPMPVATQAHRSKSPYFTPGASTLLATRPGGSTLYTDAGAAETAGVSYSYIVRGLSNCGAPSPYVSAAGVFTFGLTPGQ